MAALVDKVIVIDIEATCWKGDVPVGSESEIIEIGLALLDTRSLEVGSKESIVVRPAISSVSPFCTKLTGLTQETVDAGLPLEVACGELRRRFESKERAWASYGAYDRRMFELWCSRFQIEYPFGHTHIELRNLFALATGQTSECGLPHALRTAGLEFVGKHHRGDDDALNAARLLSWILGRTRSGTSGDRAGPESR